ncbi:MAG: ketoacyl-ACP synthase III, partial [Brevundimonas sp.]
VPAMVTDVLAGDDPASVGAYAFHQANRFIIQNLIRKLKLTPEAVPVNIDRFGNTSMSSIPLLMTTDLSARLTSQPTRMVAAGFGVGLSWGAALLDLQPLKVAETIAA